jgi:hypothetical protein
MKTAPISQIRKRLLKDARLLAAPSTELDVKTGATVAYSSEQPSHPVDNMFDGRDGPGGTFWASTGTDSTETIVLEFDHPQKISRLIFEAEERQVERTQEVRLEVSSDGGDTFRQLLVQEFVFSPRGATFQREDLRLSVTEVSQLRLTIVPHKNGSGRATITSLRLFE